MILSGFMNLTVVNIFALSIVFMCSSARADYKFVTENPYEALKRFNEDVRLAKVAKTSLGPHVIDAITNDSPFSATPAKLNRLGPITQICLVTGFKYPTSRALALRTLHEKGCGDWVITSEILRETLIGIVLIPVEFEKGRTDFCGAPGIIPPVPIGGESFSFPSRPRGQRVARV